MYYKEFDELMADKKFSAAFSKLPKQKSYSTSSAVSRTVMEEDYGFEFAPKSALVIEDGKNTSYTFLIQRDSIYEKVFENLVFEVDSLDETKAVIIKYNLTSDLTRTNHDSFAFGYESTFTAIIYNDQEATSKVWYDNGCINTTTVTCCKPFSANEPGCHTAGPACLAYAANLGLII